MFLLGVKYLFVANLNLLSNEKGTISDKTEMSLKNAFFYVIASLDKL